MNFLPLYVSAGYIPIYDRKFVPGDADVLLYLVLGFVGVVGSLMLLSWLGSLVAHVYYWVCDPGGGRDLSVWRIL